MFDSYFKIIANFANQYITYRITDGLNYYKETKPKYYPMFTEEAVKILTIYFRPDG